MTADQSSPVAAGDAGGGDVEVLAVEMCVANPTPHMYGGTHDAHRWGPCVAHEEAARWLLASLWLADLLQAARAEGARTEAVAVATALRAMSSQKGIGARVLTPGREFAADFLMDRAIELLAGGHVANGDSLPPSGRERLGVPPASAAARAASVGRGGVEGDESAFEGAAGDAQVSDEGFGDQETQGRENGDSA